MPFYDKEEIKSFYFSEGKNFRIVKQSERRRKQERGNIMHGKTQ